MAIARALNLNLRETADNFLENKRDKHEMYVMFMMMLMMMNSTLDNDLTTI
jgi:hypothetical protein